MTLRQILTCLKCVAAIVAIVLAILSAQSQSSSFLLTVSTTFRQGNSMA
jgi:hypothetical protein